MVACLVCLLANSLHALISYALGILSPSVSNLLVLVLNFLYGYQIHLLVLWYIHVSMHQVDAETEADQHLC